MERPQSEKFPGKRLHVRAIIRDGKRAFVGSQSLRRLELEKRREVGVIVTDERVVRQMQEVFEQDWAQTERARRSAKKAEKAEKKARRKPRSCVAAAVASAARQSSSTVATADCRLTHRVLRRSPEIHRRDAVDAADRAVRRARLRRRELAADVVDGVATRAARPG